MATCHRWLWLACPPAWHGLLSEMDGDSLITNTAVCDLNSRRVQPPEAAGPAHTLT